MLVCHTALFIIADVSQLVPLLLKTAPQILCRKTYYFRCCFKQQGR